MPLSRRQIIHACKQRGWSLQPIAFEGIEEFLSESEGNDAMVDLQAILDVASEKSKSAGTLTAEIWQLVVEELNGEDTVDAPKSDGNQQTAPGDSILQIVSAFQTPKLTYDTMRKHFNVQTTPGPLFGSVADKVQFHLIGSLLMFFARPRLIVSPPDKYAGSTIFSGAPANLETQTFSSQGITQWSTWGP